MKIGYFVSHFLYKDRVNEAEYHKEYAHGGTEVAAYNLALEMRKRGHQINVFTTAINRRNSVEKESSITIYRYGTNFRIASANFSWGLLHGPQKIDLDIVHAHYNMPYADYSAMEYSKKKKVPMVLTYHADAPETGGIFLRNQLQTFYNHYIIDRVLNQADTIIATSQCYIDQSRFLGRYRDKIKVIPNGINLNEFQTDLSRDQCREKLNLPLEKDIILFFGNLVKYKGPEVLLNAFHNIKNENPNTLLVFAGTGPMQRKLITQSKIQGLVDDVKFTGYVEDSLKPLYYKAVDIFCLPSLNLAEAFGIVNLEAMASGIPIIASNLGGIPEVVRDGENGLIFKPGDVEDLIKSLTYLLDNENIRRRMGEKGKRMSQDYSWIKIAEQTEEVYKNFH
jgi:glycosyltransferase involved in cell wall biosynthesis